MGIMKKSHLVRAALGATVAALLPAAALAQEPGSEIVGQPIQVTTNGVTNTVYLDPGGQLRIVTPGGNTVPGTWTAANGQLCLGAAGAQECVPYASPFQAGTPMSLTSSCGSTQTWLAAATNTPAPPPPPAQTERGERGR
jgi:hypothetical protein